MATSRVAPYPDTPLGQWGIRWAASPANVRTDDGRGHLRSSTKGGSDAEMHVAGVIRGRGCQRCSQGRRYWAARRNPEADRESWRSPEAFYFAFGSDDVVVIADLPDQRTAAAIGLAVNADGHTQSQDRCVLTPDEIDEAVKTTVELPAAGRLRPERGEWAAADEPSRGPRSRAGQPPAAGGQQVSKARAAG